MTTSPEPPAVLNSARGLAFKQISKTVRISNQWNYPVLTNVSGVVYSSQMMGLMGLSGSG